MSNYYGTTPPIIQLRAKDVSNVEQTLITCDFSNYATELTPPTYKKIEDRYRTLAGEERSLLYGYSLHTVIDAKITEAQSSNFVKFYENLIVWEHLADSGVFSMGDGTACGDYHDPKIYVKPYADGTIDYYEATLIAYDLQNIKGLLFLKKTHIELKNKTLITDIYNRDTQTNQGRADSA